MMFCSVNVQHECIRVHRHGYIWLFLSPHPQSRCLWYPPARLLLPPNSFRMPALHQQQAVLVDGPTKHLPCPGKTPPWARQTSALGAWLWAVPCDTGTWAAGAVSFNSSILRGLLVPQPRCLQLPKFHFSLRPATVWLSLWILWPASRNCPTHSCYASGSWFSERKTKLLRTTQMWDSHFWRCEPRSRI